MLENEDNTVSVFDSPIVNKVVQAKVPSVGNMDCESVTVESIPSLSLIMLMFMRIRFCHSLPLLYLLSGQTTVQE